MVRQSIPQECGLRVPQQAPPVHPGAELVPSKTAKLKVESWLTRSSENGAVAAPTAHAGTSLQKSLEADKWLKLTELTPAERDCG